MKNLEKAANWHHLCHRDSKPSTMNCRECYRSRCCLRVFLLFSVSPWTPNPRPKMFFQAEPLYQPNEDGKTASAYHFPKPYVTSATDHTNFAELAAPTPEHFIRSNRFKLCHKGLSTAMDETLLCLTPLYFNQDIPALRSFPVSFVLLLEDPQAIYSANGVYHRISRNPTMDIQNNSGTHGLSLSTIDCQARVLRPSCEKTIHINQGDLLLSTDMDACKNTPEPYIATKKLAPSLNPLDRLNFPR